ncbi:MAG: carboxypeptidase-like regulatory domain-containing protein [Paludibacter sp.]|nr:carboxypeptidase-like regulatory domain-containing protein [Paludibacter sp.]
MVLFLFCCQGIYAQHAINGKVTDSNGFPIEFVNVVLYALPDSTMVTGTTTDSNGEFSLQAASPGDAFLQISFIGYQTQAVPVKPQQIVVLQSESTQLGEIVVSGNLPRIRLRDDAIVTTVQNSVLSKAGTGNDVLKRLPSLTGDKGVYSVFGKGEAKIYINNREMRDVSELDNLNSEDIREVEIINNPGARYDASVKAVIRINTVRKTGDGFGFDVRSSYYQSQNIDLREQLNMNYRQNGLDIFGTFSYSRDAWDQDSRLRQTTYVDTLWRQENTLNVKGTSQTVRGIAGVNYEISSKHYVGMKYTQTMFPNNKSFPILNSTVFADNVFYDKWSSVEEEEERNKPAYRFNAYYNGAFGDLKIDFNTDFLWSIRGQYPSGNSVRDYVTKTSVPIT